MTTQTLTEQVHLVNIITLAQDRLQNNFRSIVNRLKSHDKQILLQNDQMKKVQLEISNKIQEKQQQKNRQIKNLSDKIQKCFLLITELTNQSRTHGDLIIECQKEIKRNNKQIIDLNNIFDQKVNQNKNQVEEVQFKIEKIQKDLYKAYEQILKKQDSTQVMKIYKSIDNTKEKVDKNQKQFKVLEHKLQKIQILNQKTQRNQNKKQIQLMRQIQQRIRKQMKGLQKSFGIPAEKTTEKQSQIADSSQNRTRQTLYGRQNRLSFKMQEEQAVSTAIKNNFQKFAISKINQKLETFQSKIKNFENSMNSFMINNKKNNKPESEEIKQKINELKPQLIKLWTKCDTLDDRIAFNQRKFQQKSKILSNLLDTQKENGVGRLDQKFKTFQTQIYTTLKQLKNKVDAKVNCHDYEKQSMIIEQKLRHISDSILLKSDKLQVKKALLFLQSKIKQIILVISQDQQVQKDALLTKKQLKCISCDKDIDKMSKFASTAGRGNWDALPNKEHSPQMLGKFGMTGFGSLSKKLKKLQSKDLPVLKSRKNGSSILQPIVNTIPETDKLNESK